MRTKSKAGLAILASGLSFAGAAMATDLIVNGSFETVTGGNPQYGGIADGTETGWNGIVSSLPYSAAYYTGPPCRPTCSAWLAQWVRFAKLRLHRIARIAEQRSALIFPQNCGHKTPVRLP